MSDEPLSKEELLILRLNLSLVLTLKSICKTSNKSAADVTYDIASQIQITLSNLNLKQQREILEKAKEYNDICESFNIIETNVKDFLNDTKTGE